MVLFIGLQAAGKSSFYRDRFAHTHAHISKDNFRNNKNPSRRQQILLETALAGGQSVVIDNTNPKVEDRRPLIDTGRLWGARIIGYFFASELKECLERNQKREGKARVPDVALYRTNKLLEPPTPGEGFDQLFRVRMDGAGGWVVEEQRNATTAEEGAGD